MARSMIGLPPIDGLLVIIHSSMAMPIAPHNPYNATNPAVEPMYTAKGANPSIPHYPCIAPVAPRRGELTVRPAGDTMQ